MLCAGQDSILSMTACHREPPGGFSPRPNFCPAANSRSRLIQSLDVLALWLALWLVFLFMMHECIRVQILISIKDNEYRRFFEIPARRTSFVPKLFHIFALGMRTKLVSNFVPILFHSRRSMTVVVRAVLKDVICFHSCFATQAGC